MPTYTCICNRMCTSSSFSSIIFKEIHNNLYTHQQKPNGRVRERERKASDSLFVYNFN